MYVCMHVCMYVCMYVSMSVYMCLCIYVYLYNLWIYVGRCMWSDNIILRANLFINAYNIFLYYYYTGLINKVHDDHRSSFWCDMAASPLASSSAPSSSAAAAASPWLRLHSANISISSILFWRFAPLSFPYLTTKINSRPYDRRSWSSDARADYASAGTAAASAAGPASEDGGGRGWKSVYPDHSTLSLIIRAILFGHGYWFL